MIRLSVNVDVDDLERAVAFYREAFGLRLARRLLDGSVVELAGAGVPVYLLRAAPGSAAAPGAGVRTYARHWTPVHLDVQVADVEAAASRACAAGAAPEGPIETHAWGRIARLADPFGHGICLVELAPGGYPRAPG